MSDYVEKRERVVDKLTGELLSDETNVIDIYRMPAEPAFIKFYIDDLASLQKLTAGETQILLYVAACADYKGMIALPTGIKKRIANSANCSDGAVNNAVNKFCKSDILRKEGGGLYELNPDYFARGKWREIRERRKEFYTKTTYRRDGTKEVETNVIETLPNVGE
jgi:hypothetical protein